MRKQSLVAAVVFAVVGAITAWVVYGVGSGSNGEALADSIIAGASAFIVGGLLWSKVALKKSPTVSVGRGALVGALVGFVAHPIYWYVSAVYAWAFLETPVGGKMGPINGLWGALVLSLVSWLFVGWITVPLGAAAGALLAALWRKPQVPTQTV